MIYEFFRHLGMILGYPVQLLFFKRRTFYESGSARRSLRRGGKLIISNHYNMLDYVMTCFAVYPRKLNAIASEDPFKRPFFNFGMRFFGAIKADRITKSMRFIDEAAAVIRDKHQLVQIFPEGRNTPDGKMHEFKQSYIVIAHRAHCPIVPVVTDGNYGPWRRASIIIGDEIDVSRYITTDKRLPSREELALANDAIYEKMLSLREQLEERKASKKRKR